MKCNIRKATGFKFLRVNCLEINQVTSKCQMEFVDKTCKKYKHHLKILHIRNGLRTKFQVKLIILRFWTKLAQKWYFGSKKKKKKKRKMKITIKF